MSIRTWTLVVSLLAISPIASPQGGLDDLLGLGSSSGAKSKGSSGVFESAAGEWRLFGGANGNGLDCAVGFVGKTGFFGFVGPTSDSKGTLLFMSPKLRPVNSLTETKMSLITDKDPPGRSTPPRKVFQLPGANAAVAMTTDMQVTLRGISDVKRVALEHNGDLVLDLAVDGTFAARDALAKCMGMPPIGAGR